jgi:enoyl-CoA hydratase/carnithine racemase
MPAESNSPIQIEREGALSVLSIDSPPLNLFDQSLIDALEQAIAELAANPPRGLLIRAEGRVVSGGVDVHVFDGLNVQAAGTLWERLLSMVHTLEELPAPDGVRSARPVPDGGVRALARV